MSDEVRFNLSFVLFMLPVLVGASGLAIWVNIKSRNIWDRSPMWGLTGDDEKDQRRWEVNYARYLVRLKRGWKIGAIACAVMWVAVALVLAFT